MDPSFRMVAVAALLMFALLLAIVSAVSIEPFAAERARTVEAGRSAPSPQL